MHLKCPSIVVSLDKLLGEKKKKRKNLKSENLWTEKVLEFV